MLQLSKVAVVGAGTMGAAIAGHLANSGRVVLLLDAVPAELTPEETARGLERDDPAVRNRLARAGLERIRQARPPALFSPEVADRITCGNVEDDLERLNEVDWIVEAVTERLEVKQALLARVDSVRRPDTIVSSNTSGLPISQIAEGRSEGFRANFLGTHFFNPPRQMKLLEVTPIATTRPEVLATIVEIGERDLGKGIVLCKDTPNFVGNRIFTFDILFCLAFTLEHGFSVEEVDRLTGPLIGRPRTATFRLLDLIGIDVMALIARNLYPRLPEDESRELLHSPRIEWLFNEMVGRGWLGNKSGCGFYQAVQSSEGRAFWPLDLETLEHRPPRKPQFDGLAAIERERDLVTRLGMLAGREDRAGQYVRAVLGNLLGYSSRRLPEIADEVKSVDDAMRWGFNHTLGPFEIWDALGLAEGVRLAEETGGAGGVAPWVRAMADGGRPAFYDRSSVELAARPVYWSITRKQAIRAAPSPQLLDLASCRAEGLIAENEGASLIDLGDGVAALELHTKLNVLDERIVEMAHRARREIRGRFRGLVIIGRGGVFSAGANLASFAGLIEAGDWAGLDRFIRKLQELMLALRHSPRPVVAAPQGWTLGGGSELAMAASRIVAAAETYLGQPEVNVGVLPAAGGCKELLRRVATPAAVNRISIALGRVFDLLITGKVSSSAAEARAWGILQPNDRVVMNADHLLAAAKGEVIAMAHDDYTPPPGGKVIYLGGSVALTELRRSLDSKDGLSEHDRIIADQIARVLCGEQAEPRWVDEQEILDRERAAFVSLCQLPKTQERIKHFLATGKSLKN